MGTHKGERGEHAAVSNVHATGNVRTRVHHFRKSSYSNVSSFSDDASTVIRSTDTADSWKIKKMLRNSCQMIYRNIGAVD
jgi:hypothetical protein